MTHERQRRPGEANPVADADAAMRPVREGQSLGKESLAMGAGTVGGPFGADEGGIVRGFLALLNQRRHRRGTAPQRRRRARRQPTLLGGGPAPDPRLPQQSLDPNARFIGEQMGSGEG